MSAQIVGNLAGIDRLLGQLLQLSPAGMKALNGQLAEEGRTLVSEQFRRQGDPQGNPWVSRNPAFGRQGGQILRDTGRFESSFATRATSDGFQVGSNFVGAGVLTQGATITPKKAKFLAVPKAGGGVAFLKKVTIPARQVLPTGEAGPIWGPRLIEVIEDFLEEIGT